MPFIFQQWTNDRNSKIRSTFEHSALYSILKVMPTDFTRQQILQPLLHTVSFEYDHRCAHGGWYWWGCTPQIFVRLVFFLENSHWKFTLDRMDFYSATCTRSGSNPSTILSARTTFLIVYILLEHGFANSNYRTHHTANSSFSCSSSNNTQHLGEREKCVLN